MSADPYKNVVPLRSGDGEKKEDQQDSYALFQGLNNKLPPMPGELGVIAKNHWVFIGKQLEACGIITSVDLSIFRRYCETYDLYVEAPREVRAPGEYQKTPNAYEQLAPWSIARDRHGSNLQKLEDKLFLNPAARRRVRLDNPNQGELEL